MATNAIEGKEEKGREQVRGEEQSSPTRRAKLTRLFRLAGMAAPFLLFAAAILAGLGFWATQEPLLGSLAVGLALAGGVLAIIAAASISDS